MSIKDRQGIELEVGDLVHIKLNDPAFVASIVEMVNGSITALSIGNEPPQVKPDKLIVQFEIELSDSLPGQNHFPLMRVINPATEIVLKRGVEAPAASKAAVQ